MCVLRKKFAQAQCGAVQSRALLLAGLLLLNFCVIYIKLGGLFAKEIGQFQWRLLRKTESLRVQPGSIPANVGSSLVQAEAAATGACPAHTERHPALASTGDASAGLTSLPPSLTSVFSDPLTYRTLEGYGLHPLPHAPSRQDEPRGTPWRGGEVQVMGSPAGPLSGPAVRAARGVTDVQGRREYHRGCLEMAGPQGTAHKVAGHGLFMPHTLPLSSMVTERLDVLAHGLHVYGVVQSWLQSARTTYDLPSSSTSHGQHSFKTARTAFYRGPWIEDAWIATFAQPVVRAVPWSWYSSLPSDSSSTPRPVVASSSSEQSGARSSTDAVPYKDKDGADVIDVLLPYDTELFHPWVPLFIPWEAIMTTISSLPSAWEEDRRAHTARRVKCDLAQLLHSNMSGVYQYVTLAQRAAGPWFNGWSGEVPLSCTQSLHEALGPVLVISSSGVGHVPIPLLAEERPFLACSAPFNAPLGSNAQQSPALIASFVGTPRLGARAAVLKALKRLDAGKTWLWWDTVSAWREYGKKAVLRRLGWRDAGASSSKDDRSYLLPNALASYSLAPRGTGPTSFRLYEALQMGVVPVYVHDGQPWLPYLKPGESWTWDVQKDADSQSLWARIGHVVGVDDLEAWLGALLSGDERLLQGAGATRERYLAQRRAIAEVRDRLFTYEGVLRRVSEWLDDPRAESTLLACQGSSYL